MPRNAQQERYNLILQIQACLAIDLNPLDFKQPFHPIKNTPVLYDVTVIVVFIF